MTVVDGRLGLPCRPLATHTPWSHGRHLTPHDNTDDGPTVALPCNANDPRRPTVDGRDDRRGAQGVALVKERGHRGIVGGAAVADHRLGSVLA
jgi:hypothetical protein